MHDTPTHIATLAAMLSPRDQQLLETLLLKRVVSQLPAPRQAAVLRYMREQATLSQAEGS